MRLLATVFLVLAARLAWAQQPPPTRQPPSVFRAATDLVEVDVVVHDKSGRFVGDLSVDDFTIEEAGQRQAIQQFYLRTADGATPWTAGPSSAIRRDPAVTVAPPSPRVFVVVFDDAHMTPSGFKRTQAAALSLFSQQFR